MRVSILIGFAFVLTGCGEHASSIAKSSTAKTHSADSGHRSKSPNEQSTVFLYVKIPESITPIKRGEKYEDPIHNALVTAGLGEVTGGGSMLGADQSITSVGVDIDVVNVEKALPIIVKVLRRAGAPKGTVIEQYKPKRIDHPVW